MIRVRLKDNKKLREIVQAIYPGYRKHHIRIRQDTSVRLWGGWWDGGSRSEWDLVTPTGYRRALVYPVSPPQFGGGEIPEQEILPGTGVLQSGTFRGKKAELTLYIHENDIESWGLSTDPMGLGYVS